MRYGPSWTDAASAGRLLGAELGCRCGAAQWLWRLGEPRRIGTTRHNTHSLLASLQQQTFNYFWETSDPVTGLAPDRYPIRLRQYAAIGFALTAYPIGVENGWITRSAAAQRVQARCSFSGVRRRARRAAAVPVSGILLPLPRYADGHALGNSEISIIDTTLLMAGVLFCGEYFNQ